MAWTSTDLTAIETAIASGVLRVTYSDGRSMEYRSMDDLFKARDAIKQALSVAAGNTLRCTLATFTKG